MPSSTSSSEPALPAASWRRGWIGLLQAFFALMVMGEILCRALAPRLIQTEIRRQRESVEAELVRPGTNGRLTVLMLGNSLLAEGVDLGELRRRVEPDIAVTRFQVESTVYFDWYFGIRRLLKSGAKPDVVALVLSPDQLASMGHRGDYSAYLLMTTRDAWTAGWKMGLSNTQSADLVVSRLSALFGMRTNIRKRTVLALVPGLGRVMPILTERMEPRLRADAVEVLSRERLEALQAFVESHGSRFVLIVPPTNDDNTKELTEAVVRGGRAAGVQVMLPIAPGTLRDDSFREDGFHLSRIGARHFTDRLAALLKQLHGSITNG